MLKSFIITIILAFLAKFMFNFCVDMGIGVPFNKVVPGKCRVIPGVECGSEKISVTSDGLAFITSGFRMLTNCNKALMTGKIYVFDFNRPEQNATRLTIVSDTMSESNFDPHGMDIIEVGSQIKIYVVNHAGKDAVEVFHYTRDEPTVLKHTDTLTDAKFTCLNDLALIHDDKFYITNMCADAHANFLWNAFEFFANLHTANVVFYDSGKTSFVVQNGCSFNGIALSRDQKQVIVAGNHNSSLNVYKRQDGNGALHFFKSVFIGNHPDNIWLDRNGDGKFYIGAHKTPIHLVLATFNQSDYVAGTGLSVSVADDAWNDVDVVEILNDDGRKFVKGIATTVHYKGQYLFGSVFHKLGYCAK